MQKLKIYEKLELHFALGKAYEDIKDYKNAFYNIEKANSLMKLFTKYKIEKDEKLFQKIKYFFTGKTFNATKQNKIKIEYTFVIFSFSKVKDDTYYADFDEINA